MFKKTLSLIVIICFFLTSLTPLSKAQADSVLGLPTPWTMVNLSPAYMPVMIKGVKVHTDNPLLFDFILDTGKSGLKIDSAEFKTESQKLIKYFLAALTIKEDDLWVNLSPYEKDRMIPQELGQTEMGRDMLAQDYILKQLTASLIYPEKELGKKFWDNVYTKARQMYGATNIPVNTFNKVWIVADKAKVLERNNTAYVVGSHLKVMLEEDYLALEKYQGQLTQLPSEAALNVKASQGTNRSPSNTLASQIVKEIILPELEKEVNQGQNFATLRQMFYSMILASWYKLELKESLLNQVYSNKGKTSGVLSDDPAVKEKIYQQYLQAYKKGVFNYIKEDLDTVSQQPMPRKYFSGGLAKNLGIKDAMEVERGRPTAGDDFSVGGDMAMATVQVAKSKVEKTAERFLSPTLSFLEARNIISKSLEKIVSAGKMPAQLENELLQFIALKPESPELKQFVLEVFVDAFHQYYGFEHKGKNFPEAQFVYGFVHSLNSAIIGIETLGMAQSAWVRLKNSKNRRTNYYVPWTSVSSELVRTTIKSCKRFQVLKEQFRQFAGELPKGTQTFSFRNFRIPRMIEGHTDPLFLREAGEEWIKHWFMLNKQMGDKEAEEMTMILLNGGSIEIVEEEGSRNTAAGFKLNFKIKIADAAMMVNATDDTQNITIRGEGDRTLGTFKVADYKTALATVESNLGSTKIVSISKTVKMEFYPIMLVLADDISEPIKEIIKVLFGGKGMSLTTVDKYFGIYHTNILNSPSNLTKLALDIRRQLEEYKADIPSAAMKASEAAAGQSSEEVLVSKNFFIESWKGVETNRYRRAYDLIWRDTDSPRTSPFAGRVYIDRSGENASKISLDLNGENYAAEVSRNMQLISGEDALYFLRDAAVAKRSQVLLNPNGRRLAEFMRDKMVYGKAPIVSFSAPLSIGSASWGIFNAGVGIGFDWIDMGRGAKEQVFNMKGQGIGGYENLWTPSESVQAISYDPVAQTVKVTLKGSYRDKFVIGSFKERVPRAVEYDAKNPKEGRLESFLAEISEITSGHIKIEIAGNDTVSKIDAAMKSENGAAINFQTPEAKQQYEARQKVLTQMAKNREFMPILGFAGIKLYNDATGYNVTVEEAATNSDIQSDIQAWAQKEYGARTIPMMMDLTYEFEAAILSNLSLEQKDILRKSGKLQVINGKETIIPFHELTRPQLDLKLAEAGIDWHNLKPFDPKAGRLSVPAQTIANFKQKMELGAPKVALVISPFTLTGFLMGDENASLGAMGDEEYQEQFNTVFEYSKKFIKDYIHFLIREGTADAIVFLDPRPTVMLSPEQFGEYSVKAINELSAYAHSLGVLTGAHPCRPMNKEVAQRYLPQMAKYNVDILSVDNIFSLPDVYDYIQQNSPYQTKPVIFGNMDSIQTLPQGTPQEVQKEAREIFQNMGHRPFVFCSSCDIERITGENMKFLGIAAHEGANTKPPRIMTEEETEASVDHLDRLIDDHINRLINPHIPSSSPQVSVAIWVDRRITDADGFSLAETFGRSPTYLINPERLNRDKFMDDIARAIQLNDPETNKDWQDLRDQVWLDGKLELAVRDVPWIQETNIHVTDIYNSNSRFVVGLGNVRGSLSYQGFYVNGYSNPELKSAQAILNKHGVNMFPIPVQMGEDNVQDIPRMLKAILKDEQIVRIALTQPVKVAAVDTGLFKDWDPDTLPTGAVNTAAIEGKGSKRHFVGRSTDGEGTVAMIQDELVKLDKQLGGSTVAVLGLGGFGRAAVGKMLTAPNPPAKILIADIWEVNDTQKSVEAIIAAYRQKYGKDPQTTFEVFKISDVDSQASAADHPFKNADVLIDATGVGMKDEKMALQNLQFIHPGMLVTHAAYRDGVGNYRVAPILEETKKRGAVIRTGIADWVGHQWLQVLEDLKRLEGLTPQSPDWNAPRWEAVGRELREAAESWAKEKGFSDAAIDQAMKHQSSMEILEQRALGGIDLNAKNMGLDVSRDGKGIEMKFDPAMVAEFRKGNFTGVEGIILRIVPIESPLPLLGLAISPAENKLAKV
ncbi:MAG: hypothetical protein HQL12_02340 [Candidatus Omnitrophica bacterium]|nr:hypothetical protein [Candidatus Omnitrophota bacterium]